MRPVPATPVPTNPTDPAASGGDVAIRAATIDDGPAVRRHCLAVVAEVFGHHYRPDWHADLDRLTDPVHDYHPARRGRLLLAERSGTLLGCGGLRSLGSKPALAAALADRYPEPALVGSIWRVYVSPGERGGGLGRMLIDQLEDDAARFGYRRLYLHTSADSPRSVAFWERCGYRTFRHDRHDPDSTVHLDKLLPTRSEATAGG